MASAKTTTDHDEIRDWVESRGGKPARVIATGRGKKNARGGDPGILRIDFPGFSGEGTLETISWDEWFDAFDRNKLAFLYQERVRGNPSRFSKLVDRKNATSGRRAASSSKRSAAKRSTAKRKSSKAGRSITAGTPSRAGSRTRAARTSRSGTARGARGSAGRGTTRGRSSSRKRSSRARA